MKFNMNPPRFCFRVECYDKDKKLVWQDEAHNIVTDEGCNYLLDVAFKNGTKITTWYLTVFENNHTPAAGNTYATPGYTESTAYDETNRPEWTSGSITSKSLTNSASKASLTFNATKTIYGLALVGGGTDPSVKGNTAGGGKLYCVSQFTGGSKAVEAAYELKIWATVSMSNS